MTEVQKLKRELGRPERPSVSVLPLAWRAKGMLFVRDFLVFLSFFFKVWV